MTPARWALLAVLAGVVLLIVRALGPSKFVYYFLLRPVAKVVGWLGRKTVKGIQRTLLETAAWLGYQGWRFLIFLFLLLLVFMTWRMFDATRAAWLGAVFLVFALTGDKRRQVRASRSVRALHGKVDGLVAAAGKGAQQTVGDASWRDAQAGALRNWWSLRRYGVDRDGFQPGFPTGDKQWFTTPEPPRRDQGGKDG